MKPRQQASRISPSAYDLFLTLILVYTSTKKKKSLNHRDKVFASGHSTISLEAAEEVLF